MKKRLVVFLTVGILALVLLAMVFMIYTTGLEGSDQSVQVFQAGAEGPSPKVEPFTPSPAAPEDALPSASPAESDEDSPGATVPPEGMEEPVLRFLAVGDIMMGRGVESRLRKNGKPPTYSFEEVLPIFRQGDILFGNLEHPVTDGSKSLQPVQKGVKGGKYVLRCKTDTFEGIKFAGFNLLSLANNHILDHYEEGLYDTMDILRENGIVWSGAGKNLDEARKPAIIEKKGITVGLLSYTDFARYTYDGDPPLYFAAEENKSGVAPLHAEMIEEDIQALKGQVDLIAVSLHWGIEESFQVTKQQIELAHRLIDQGVDMILGHHTHQFQGIEVYKGKLIAYSLGNFIFDQGDPENQEGFILDMEYSKGILTKLEAIPIRVPDRMHVVPVEGQEAQELLKREVELSLKLGSSCKVDNGKITFDLSH